LALLARLGTRSPGADSVPTVKSGSMRHQRSTRHEDPSPFVPVVEDRIDRSPARQVFGAHRACLDERLAEGFTIELDPLEHE
jgi:hypothetical protein